MNQNKACKKCYSCVHLFSPLYLSCPLFQSMEAITHQLALRLWEGNFGREKLPRYFEGGNLVRIKLPNTTASFSAAATTTTPKLAQPIRASAGAGARTEPDTTPFSSEMASHDPASKDTRIAQISSAIRVIPDFPKPGTDFLLPILSLSLHLCTYFFWVFFNVLKVATFECFV